MRFLPNHDVEWQVRVLGAVQQRFADVDQEYLDLLRTPLQAPREGAHGDALQSVVDHTAVVGADRLHLLVARPRADGHLEGLLVHVDEPGGLDVLLVLLHAQKVDAEGGEAILDTLEELDDIALWWKSAVVAARHEPKLLQLNPSAGFQGPVVVTCESWCAVLLLRAVAPAVCGGKGEG